MESEGVEIVKVLLSSGLKGVRVGEGVVRTETEGGKTQFSTAKGVIKDLN